MQSQHASMSKVDQLLNLHVCKKVALLLRKTDKLVRNVSYINHDHTSHLLLALEVHKRSRP